MSNTSTIAEKIISAAKERGEKIYSEAKEKYEKLYEEKLNQLEREIEEEKELEMKHIRERIQQLLSAVRLAEKNETQRLKRRLLEETYSKWWEKVLETSTYRKYLEKHLKEYSKPGDRLIVSAKETERFKKEFSDLLAKYKVELAEEKGRFRGGFIIPRGDIRLNCTIDETFKELIDKYEIEAAAMLFQN